MNATSAKENSGTGLISGKYGAPFAVQMSLCARLGKDMPKRQEYCEFEERCHADMVKRGLLKRAGKYRCGWLDTNIEWCPKRRRLIEANGEASL